MTSIADRYRALVSERRFETDPAQTKLVGKLDALAVELRGYKAEGKLSGLSWLFGVKLLWMARFRSYETRVPYVSQDHREE